MWLRGTQNMEKTSLRRLTIGHGKAEREISIDCVGMCHLTVNFLVPG